MRRIQKYATIPVLAMGGIEQSSDDGAPDMVDDSVTRDAADEYDVQGVIVPDVQCPAVIRSYLGAARIMWNWSGDLLPTQFLHIWSEGAIMIVMGITDGVPVRAGAIISSTNSHLNLWFIESSGGTGVAHYALFSAFVKSETLYQRIENDSSKWALMDSRASCGRFWYGAGAPRGHLRGSRVMSDPHKYFCDEDTGAFIEMLESDQKCICGCMKLEDDESAGAGVAVVGSAANPLLKMRACTRQEMYTVAPGLVSDDIDDSAVHFTFLMCDIPQCRWTQENFLNIISAYRLFSDSEESDASMSEN